MPGPRSTSHIKQYTPTQFSAAIAAVSSGSLSIRKAAQAHSIPFSTLQRHFQGTPQAKRSYETSSREMQKLTPEQEENIAMWVLAQENLGLPVKMEDIRRFADRVLEVGLRESQGLQKGGTRRKSVGVKDGKGGKNGKNGGEGGEGVEGEGTVTVGKHWGPKFMQRHPQLKAAREARRKELKKGLREKQVAAGAAAAGTPTSAAFNTATPAAAANGVANGQTAPASVLVTARFVPAPVAVPQTPTPVVPVGRQQRNSRQQNGQQPHAQQQHQHQHIDVDPELMDHDQIVMDEDEEEVAEGQGNRNGVQVKDETGEDEEEEEEEEEEEYEDEQTPDLQLLMDSQRYSRMAVNGRH